MRVLVVEDDPGVAGGLVRGLRSAGFDVELATTGAVGARLALEATFAIMVLDLNLPERDGFSVLELLRGRSTTPVIVLTARTELGDRLRSFELGAVDFVAKPFFIEELVARIRSRLGTREHAPHRIVRWADVSVDLDGRTATRECVSIELTRHEFDILGYLVKRPGRAVSRAQLAASVLTPFEPRADRTIDSHIVRVRKKLGPRAAAHLVTVWGVGYRFEPEAAGE